MNWELLNSSEGTHLLSELKKKENALKQKFQGTIYLYLLEFFGMNAFFLPRFLYVSYFKSFSLQATMFVGCGLLCGMMVTVTEIVDAYLFFWFFKNLPVPESKEKFWVICTFFLVNSILRALGLSFKILCIDLASFVNRKNLTHSILKNYFKKKNYYTILQQNNVKFNKEFAVDNPDYNISKDCEDFSNNRSRLEVDVLSCLVKIFASYFLMTICKVHWILFLASLIWPFLFLTTFFTVPITSHLTLIRKRFEGRYRYCHARIKEYCESMAFYRGEKAEKKIISGIFNKLIIFTILHAISLIPSTFLSFLAEVGPTTTIILSFIAVIFFTTKYDHITSPDEFRATIMSHFKLASIPLFGIVQIFQLTDVFSSLVGNTQRVYKLFEACHEAEKLEDTKTNQFMKENPNSVRLVDVTIATPKIQNFDGKNRICENGKVLVQNLNLEVSSLTDSLLIQGPSGCGKSSLLRIIAGLWHPQAGIIERPFKIGRNGIFFIPQKPYLFKGTLKENLMYPFRETELWVDERYDFTSPTENQIAECLELANLNHLIISTKLGANPEEEKEKIMDWELDLSADEKQKMGFARLFYHRPKFALLDESTSSLDAEDEAKMYSTCKKLGIIVISVSNRQSTKQFHDKILKFNGIDGHWITKKMSESELKEAQFDWSAVSHHAIEKTSNNNNKEMPLDEDIEEEIALGRQKLQIDKKTGFNYNTLKRLLKLSFVMCIPHSFVLLSMMFHKPKAKLNFKANMKRILKQALLDLFDTTMFIFFLAFILAGSLTYAASRLFLGFEFSPIFNKDLPKSVTFALYSIFICGLCGFFMAGFQFFTQILGISWRRKITWEMEKKYFKNKVFYKIHKLSPNSIPDADARITQDAEEYTTGFENHGISSIMSAISLNFLIGLVNVIVSSYFTYYSPTIIFLFSIVTFLLQIVLMGFVARIQLLQDYREYFYRFSLIRMREYAEQIAFYGGQDNEKENVLKKYDLVMQNKLYLIFLNFSLCVYSFLTQEYAFSMGIFFSGLAYKQKTAMNYNVVHENLFKLGNLRQIGNNSVVVFNSFLSLGPNISKNLSSVGRVSEALEIFKKLQQEFENEPQKIEITKEEKKRPQQFGHENDPFFSVSDVQQSVYIPPNAKNKQKYVEKYAELLEEEEPQELVNRSQQKPIISTRKLDVFTPSPQKKKILIENLNLDIYPNDRILICGPPSGCCGKSSLLRTLGTLWPIQGDGKVKIETNSIMFIPQKPYLVFGSLKKQIIYPDCSSKLSDDSLFGLLEEVNLSTMVARFGNNLNTIKEWSTVLSVGEQQKLSFARLFYHAPKIAILDEGTSGMDHQSENNCLALSEKYGICVICVGNGENLEKHFNRMLKCDGKTGWSLFEKIIE